MNPNLSSLTTTDWAVLTCLSEEAGHGFKLAGVFGSQGELGFLWRIARPQVYRALEYLSQEGLIEPVRQEQSEAGPSRTVYVATPEGQRAVQEWLHTPVQHLRNGRSDLLLKLVFLERKKIPTQPLLVAQREIFEHIRSHSQAQLQEASNTGRIALQWRIAATSAAIAFIEELAREQRTEVAGSSQPDRGQ